VEVAVRGKPLDPGRREFVEMDHYQSGKADAGARGFAGPDAQPWERVLEHHEPLVPPAMRWLLSHTALALLSQNVGREAPLEPVFSKNREAGA